MRITQVFASRGGWGGLERHVLDLARELAAAGHEITTLCDAAYAERFAEVGAVRLVSMQHSRFDPRLSFSLARALVATRPDLTHAHAAKATTLVGRLPRALTAARVATVHACKRSPRQLDRFDEVIAVSGRVAAGLATASTVVHHGIAAARLAPQNDDVASTCDESGRPRVLAIGRLTPVKGLDVAIEAVAGLPLDFDILGDGPLATDLARHAERLTTGTPTRVRLLGHCDDLPRRLARADAVLISSQREGFSYVMAEALRSGVPVAATDVADLARFLPPAAIAAPGDAAQLRAALQWTLAHREAFTPAFAAARETFTLDRMTTQTLRVYEAALATATQPGRRWFRHSPVELSPATS